MSSRKHSKQCNNFFHKVPTLNVFLFVGIVSKLLKVFSINCTKDYIHSSSQTSFLPVFWLNSEQHTDNFHFDWSYYFPTELKLLFSHYSSCSEFWTCNACDIFGGGKKNVNIYLSNRPPLDEKCQHFHFFCKNKALQLWRMILPDRNHGG
jgi:hypothetical protein